MLRHQKKFKEFCKRAKPQWKITNNREDKYLIIAHVYDGNNHTLVFKRSGIIWIWNPEIGIQYKSHFVRKILKYIIKKAPNQ